MKFVISKNTLTISQASVKTVIREFDVEVPSVSVNEIVAMQVEATADLKHVSVTEADGEVTYEISDELLERILGLYTRAIRLLALFATPIKAMAALYKAEIAEITQMLLAEK